jgi:hypothetical protein
VVLGTPAYMSYEQASGMKSEELDKRYDIYVPNRRPRQGDAKLPVTARNIGAGFKERDRDSETQSQKAGEAKTQGLVATKEEKCS